MSETVTCLDCANSFVPWYMWFSGAAPKHRRYCRRSHVPAQTVYNPVTGGEREAARYQSCAVFRIGRSCEGNCGADGFYWQPKKDRDLFKYIKLVSR